MDKVVQILLQQAKSNPAQIISIVESLLAIVKANPDLLKDILAAVLPKQPA